MKLNNLGFNLLEMAIVITIIGILMGILSPIYQRANEITKIDSAVANLQVISNAQFLYIAKHKESAIDLDALVAENFLSQDFADKITTNQYFDYEIIQDSSGCDFRVVATRKNSAKWSGDITIDETGTITGSISSDDYTITPPSNNF